MWRNEMSNLKKFIEENKVEFSKKRVGVEFFESFEKKLNAVVGNQLKKYILDYGYLAYKSIEMYGITANQAMNSDMVKKSIFLHNHFECTKGLVVLEDAGDGDFFLINNEDDIFEFIPDSNRQINPKNQKLFDYIYERFISVSEIRGN
jgi:hypothetical protein